MNTSSEPVDLRPPRPTVYLDLWVWIRLARAAAGKPREAFDVQILTAVHNASAAGGGAGSFTGTAPLGPSSPSVRGGDQSTFTACHSWLSALVSVVCTS